MVLVLSCIKRERKREKFICFFFRKERKERNISLFNFSVLKERNQRVFGDDFIWFKALFSLNIGRGLDFFPRRARNRAF